MGRTNEPTPLPGDPGVSPSLPKSPRKKATGPAAQQGESPAHWLTRLAFGLTLVLVILRMSMQEILRNAWLPAPGGVPVPGVPGPATSIWLDLLCCVPALLVLARRVFDDEFRLRFARSHLIMFALAVWTLASVFWSSDRFAAMVSAFNWSAALVLLWSTSQLVRDALRLRLVAGSAFGLLLVLLFQGYYYRFVDVPDLQQNWSQHHGEFLAQQGAAANGAEAGQIEKNVMGGVPTGFNLSRNTYAAVLLFLMVIAAGIILQRRADGDSPASWIPIIPALALGLVMLYGFVQSKTAFATPVMAGALLVVLWRHGRWISSHAVRLYSWGVGLFVLLIAAVVGHGLKHGTLVHVSLTFRWQYWVGAARIFIHHPWLGTGWANFGSWYTAYRLPQAAEEPIDPHNFLVRAFVELGAVGGILMIAWMLRLWWEWTSAVAPRITSDYSPHAGAERSAAPDLLGSRSRPLGHPGFPTLFGLAVIAIAANAAFSIDWDSQWALIVVETFKRLLFLLAMLGGVCAVSIRSFADHTLDDRPAPWILVAMVLGLGLFLFHNLIDFSMFETGPTFLFALVAGSALGMRLPKTTQSRPRRAIAIVSALLGCIIWLLVAGTIAIPIAEAESLSRDADELIRTARPTESRPQGPLDARKLERARDELIEASSLIPYNGDYPFRAEQAQLLDRTGDPHAALRSLNEAIAADPRRIRYLNARAALESSLGDFPHALEDYAQILRLDPHNLELRTAYARLLDGLGQREQAVHQYKTVLHFNSLLAPDEIRRLSPEQVERIHRAVRQDLPR